MISKDIISELEFKTSRSGGPGGQNVNKVATKVQLLFHVENSFLLSQDQKNVLILKLSNRISNEGFLSLSSSATRSQLANKELVINRFFELIQHALTPEIARKTTKLPLSVKMSRLKNKKIKSERKANRQKPEH